MLPKKIHFQEEKKIKRKKQKPLEQVEILGSGISWNIKKGKKSWTPRSN
jgi:hypothetical protein